MLTKIQNFFKDFFAALNNTGDGHSLKKILAIGSFWLLTYVCIRFTDKDNLVMVITVISANILALMGINTYANLKCREQDGFNTPDVTKQDAPDASK